MTENPAISAKSLAEKIYSYGSVIFWSAPIKTFSRTRLTKIVESFEARAMSKEGA
jgi:hypothetical protein